MLHQLHALWREPQRNDEYFGTLVNAYLARGGFAQAVSAGESYVDVGTLNGYREATRLLEATHTSDWSFALPMRRPPPRTFIDTSDVSPAEGDHPASSNTSSSPW